MCFRDAFSEDVEEDAAIAGGVGAVSLPQQNMAAWASAARPLIGGGSCGRELDAARSWPHVQIDASFPPQRHKSSLTSGRASRSAPRTSLSPLGSAGAMGLNLRAANIVPVRLRGLNDRRNPADLWASVPRSWQDPRQPRLQTCPGPRLRRRQKHNCTSRACASCGGVRDTCRTARRACPSS